MALKDKKDCPERLGIALNDNVLSISPSKALMIKTTGHEKQIIKDILGHARGLKCSVNRDNKNKYKNNNKIYKNSLKKSYIKKDGFMCKLSKSAPVKPLKPSDNIPLNNLKITQNNHNINNNIDNNKDNNKGINRDNKRNNKVNNGRFIKNSNNFNSSNNFKSNFKSNFKGNVINSKGFKSNLGILGISNKLIFSFKGSVRELRFIIENSFKNSLNSLNKARREDIFKNKYNTLGFLLLVNVGSVLLNLRVFYRGIGLIMGVGV